MGAARKSLLSKMVLSDPVHTEHKTDLRNIFTCHWAGTHPLWQQ